MTAPSSESFRSRPLPPIPPDSPLAVGSCSTSPPFDPLSHGSGYNGSDRNSILTFTSVGTNLPRYSAIDFLDPNFSLEQVDHWSEADGSLVAVAGPAGNPSTTSVDSRPPEYTSNATSPTTPRNYSSSRRPRFVLHRFHLGCQSRKIGPGKEKQSTRPPWATLKLISRSPALGSRIKTPRFIGGDAMRGSVDLCLDAPMNVHSVKLVLKGKVQLAEGFTTSSSLVARDHIFFDESFVIYSKKSSSDPRWNGQCEVSKNKEFNGSLHGSYAFSFSLPFPTSVEHRSGKGKDRRDSRDESTVPILMYEAPPSFREQNTSSAVVYELGVVITHGTLRSKSKINTEVIFVPKKVSPPASEKRQVAYQEGALLPGPAVDPEGWHATDPIVIQGQFLDRTVEAKATLYLAKPVTYTRGTVIPCYLTLSGLDFTFLHALSTPHAINLRLSRCITHHSLGNVNENKEADAVNCRKTYLAKAVWWNPPKTDMPLDPKERQLEAEVHLPKDLLPSCGFPLFTVEYALELSPVQFESFIQTNGRGFKTGQHKADEEDEPPISKCPINIATFHEHGPIPVAFTTPVVEDKEDSQKGAKKARNLEYVPVWASGTGSLVQFPPVVAQ